MTGLTSIVIVMFSGGVMFLGFTIITLADRQKRSGHFLNAAFLADLCLICLCNGLYMYERVPDRGTILGLFIVLDLFWPLGAAFSIRSLGLAQVTRAYRRGTLIAVLGVFLFGATLILSGPHWMMAFDMVYVCLFLAYLAVAIVEFRFKKFHARRQPGFQVPLVLFYVNIALTALMCVTQLARHFALRNGVWILFIGSALATEFATFLGRNAGQRTDATAEDRNARYHHSRLDGVNIDQSIVRLNGLMRTEQLYRNPNLSLARLAHRMDMNVPQLSELLNLHLGQNFAEYVNTFRLEEAKDTLVRVPNRSILQIGMDCGFNSKSSFNTVFHKATGVSPSEYRKQESVPQQ